MVPAPAGDSVEIIGPLRLLHHLALVVHPHPCLLVLLLHMPLFHSCMMHVIQWPVVAGPTGRRGTKGGVSSSAEDLRPVSEVDAGVNFRPAGQVRELVVLQGGDQDQAPGGAGVVR